jgi:hypothetical protein
MVLKAIEADMVEKAYPDWPQYRDEIGAINEYKPFDDKEPAEIQGIILSRAADDPARIRWENWSEIVRLIQRAIRPRFFHELTPELRDQIIDAATTTVQAQIRNADLMPDVGQMADFGIEDMTDESDDTDDNDEDNA